MADKDIALKCPLCQTAMHWSTENIYRPFCSEHCKNKDYLSWANEENYIQSDSPEEWSEQ